jgi:hypothetical protein
MIRLRVRRRPSLPLADAAGATDFLSVDKGLSRADEAREAIDRIVAELDQLAADVQRLRKQAGRLRGPS